MSASSSTKAETTSSNEQTTNPNEAAAKAEKELDNLVKRVLYYKNPYDVLDLPASATVEEIQKKYKKVSEVH
jgi:hypothetical protein